MPADQAQYIHRVGRTARAGKLGKALLLLHDFENRFLGSLADMPVETLQPNSPQVREQQHTSQDPFKLGFS